MLCGRDVRCLRAGCSIVVVMENGDGRDGWGYIYIQPQTHPLPLHDGCGGEIDIHSRSMLQAKEIFVFVSLQCIRPLLTMTGFNLLATPTERDISLDPTCLTLLLRNVTL